MYLLGGKHKWRQKRVDKSRDKIGNKAYAEYKQCELNEKIEKTGRALGKHVNNLYSTGIPQVVKIRDEKSYSKIINEQMANLGCLLVLTFSNFLASVSCAAHTVNNLDLSDEQGFENKGYESN